MLNFKAPETFKETLNRKYKTISLSGPAFKIEGENAEGEDLSAIFSIDGKISEIFKMPDKEVSEFFKGLVWHFLSVCKEFSVPIILRNIRLIIDDEMVVKGGCNVVSKDMEKDIADDWNLIFLGRRCVQCKKSFLGFIFKFYHELYHVWRGTGYGVLEDLEISTELIATVCLKRRIQTPEEEKIFHEIVVNPRCSYIARSFKHEGKYFDMLFDPEEALKSQIGGF